MLLSNKIIVVTGGCHGIGYECVKAYAKEGARIAILDIHAADNLISEIGDGHIGLLCDVADEKQVAAAIQQTASHFGKIDAVHNNAGIASPAKALHETTAAEWQALMNVNLFSIYLTTRYALPYLLQSKGCILNTSSLVGEIGQAQHAAYSATKGAVNTLTKSMAIDYAESGVRVNAVAPAGVRTHTLKQWITEQPKPETMEKYLDDIHLLGYCPEGDVIADACVYLLSDKARFITGCILPVSGGCRVGIQTLIEKSIELLY